jgi:murein DD-endopeptidase MepM/ murein hydrolase activator NlpD
LKRLVKKQFRSKILALASVLALFLPQAGSVFAATSLYQQRDSLKQQVSTSNTKSQQQQAQAAALQKEVSSLENQINYMAAKISQTSGEISTKQTEVENTKAKIATEEQNLQNSKKKLADVLSDWYMKGSPSFSEAIVATGSLSKFIDQSQYFEAIRSQISDEIAKVKELKLALENSKKDQEKQLADLQTLQNTQTTQKRSLSYSQNSKQQMAEIAAQLSSKYATEAQAASNKLAQVEGEIRQAELAAASRYNSGNRNTITRDGTSTRGFAWPISNFRYGCPFGYSDCYFSGVFHSGIDLIADPMSPVRAAKGGTIEKAVTGVGNTYAWSKSYGNHVIIQHEGGVETLYGHLDSVEVSVGQTVEKGQIIGYEGNTGYSTGYHLHFEVRLGGIADNPDYYLP